MPINPGVSFTIFDLFEGTCLDGILERYAREFPGARLRAICVHWARWYFLRTTSVSVAAALFLQRRLRIDPAVARLELDPLTSRPERIVVVDDGSPAEVGGATILSWLESDHLDFAIERLAQRGHTPKRILWSEAALQIFWLAKTVWRATDAIEGSRRRARSLIEAFDSPHGLAGRPNRFFRPVITSPDGSWLERAVCCLIHQLGPDRSRCPICPARKSARLRQASDPTSRASGQARRGQKTDAEEDKVPPTEHGPVKANGNSQPGETLFSDSATRARLTNRGVETSGPISEAVV